MLLAMLALALSAVRPALSHGYVQQISSNGQLYQAWNAYWLPEYDKKKDPAMNVTRPFYSNSPIVDVTSANMTCNNATTTPMKMHMDVKAGQPMTFFTTKYDISHYGPVLLYLADCKGDCSSYDTPGANDKVWFKVAHEGMYADIKGSNGKPLFATELSLNHNSTWTAAIPSYVAPGAYLMRYEQIALHEAENLSPKGSQYFMSCTQINLTSSGTGKPQASELVSFPGAYKADDPGLHVNIYYPILKNYTIPGPPVWAPAGQTAPVTDNSKAKVATSSKSPSADTVDTDAEEDGSASTDFGAANEPDQLGLASVVAAPWHSAGLTAAVLAVAACLA